MLTIEQLSRFAHQLADEARVRAGYYKEQLRHLAPGGDQIASGTIMIAPHGHSWAHSPHPLQKS
jgi:hypothetical protein